MVVKYTYQIKFPFGASFNRDAKYLVYSSLFNRIKKITCINQEGTCEKCSLNNSCIYYLLSGENFDKYPAIFIDRLTIEKKKLSNNEVLELNFYLFKNLLKYEGFIRGFFETENYLFNTFYQILNYKKDVLNLMETYDGNIIAITPIYDLNNIKNQINYYNEKYKTSINNNLQVEAINLKEVIDENIYYVNKKTIKVKGVIGKFKVINLDKVFFLIGLGKLNYFGGGRINEDKN